MNRSIGLVGFTFIGVSGILGSGWLFSPLLTSQLAGPASIISWLIGAAGMLLLALCFAEVSALMPVAGGIIFAILGFRHAIDMAGEVKQPRRTIPLALILTILICTLVYVLMQIAFIGALGPHDLESGWQGLHFENDLGPIAGVVAGLGIAWMSTILYAGAIAGPLGASLVATGSNARVGQALAATRLLPDAFGQISQRGVPLNALLLNLAIGIPVVLWVPFQEAVALNSAAISLSLAAGPLGVFSLRLQLPEAIRQFRLPLVHVSAILAFSMVTMIIYWSGWDLLAGLLLSIAVFLYAVHCRLPQERITQFVQQNNLAKTTRQEQEVTNKN